MGNSKTIWRWNLTTREIGTNTEYPEVLCRHYSLGFGLGEAPDEAHRGQGLPWPRWEELPGGWGSTPKGVPFILGKGARDWLSHCPLQFETTVCMTQFSNQWDTGGNLWDNFWEWLFLLMKEGSPLLLPPALQLRMLSWEVVMWCSSSHPVTVRWILWTRWRC